MPNHRINTKSFSVWLYDLTAIYLFSPYLIFFIGWLQAPWALFFSILLITGYIAARKAYLADADLRTQIGDWGGKASFSTFGLMLLACVFLIAISGAGGYGAQIRDWEKHEIILSDLIRRDWPVIYNYLGVDVGLVYYIAYYLPAALVGKLAGIDVAHHFLALWTLVGLVLSVIWFAIISRQKPAYAVTIFIFFSGLSIIGATLTLLPGADLHPEGVTWGRELGEIHLGTWAVWQYRSNMAALFWVPQHAIPAWLVSGVLIASFVYSPKRINVLWFWSASALWSPFTTLGLLPLIAADSVKNIKTRWWQGLRVYASPQNLVGIMLMLVGLLYYATKLKPISIVFATDFRYGTVFSEMGRWSSPLQLGLALLIFWILEFAIYFLLDRYLSYRDAEHMRTIYRAVFISLLILPIFVFGQFNDLVMGASLPMLFFVATIVGRNGYLLHHVARWRSLVWVFVIILAGISPAVEIFNQLAVMARQGAWRKTEIGATRTLAEQYVIQPSLMQQYASRLDTPFFTLLGRLDAGSLQVTTPPFAPLLFADSIVLTDVWIKPLDADAGDTIDVQLLFQAIQQVDTNYAVALRLIDTQNNVIWENQAWPLGMPTSTWTPSRQKWHDHYAVIIPAEAEPGLHRLEMYLFNPETNDRITPRRIDTGEETDATTPLALIKVGDLSQTQKFDSLDTPVSFGSGMALISYNLTNAVPLSAGAVWTIELLWQTQTMPQAHLTRFAHVIDGDGKVLAQNDNPLVDDFLSAHLWREGLQLSDRFSVEVPEILVAGEYQIVVGLYDSQTQQRLSVYTAGQSIGDAYRLDQLNISSGR